MESGSATLHQGLGLLFIIIILSCLVIVTNPDILPSEVLTVEVPVTIVDSYRKEGSLRPIYTGTSTIWSKGSDRYEIVVDYEGERYVLTSKETYYSFFDKVGEPVIGILQMIVFSDGTTTQRVIELKQ